MATDQPDNQPSSNKSKIAIIVMAVLILAMGAALVWALSTQSTAKQEKEEAVAEAEDLKLEVDEAYEKLRKIKSELAEKSMEADDNAERIKELLDQLEGLQSRMNAAVRDKRQSASEKQKLEGMLDEANYLVKTYRDKIKELEERNQQLTTEVTGLEGDVQQLEGQKEQLEKDVEERDAKISQAAVLKAADFTYKGYTKRGKENDGPYFKNRDIRSSLKACFSLLENPVAEVGKRELFVIVRKPSGNILENMKTSSGYFRLNGKQMAFTMKTTASYDKKRTRVCAMFKFPDGADKLEDGLYPVEVYDGERMIGEGEFKVD